MPLNTRGNSARFARAPFVNTILANIRTESKGSNPMGIQLFRDLGTPLENQTFSWKDLVQKPISKLDEDAFTRIRVILMNGIESEAVRFSHAAARMNRDFQIPLARLRRVEHHQQTMI